MPAHAEETGPRVVILGAERARGALQEAISRVRGELSAAGLSLVTVSLPLEAFDWRAALEQAARQQNAVAAIGIAPDDEAGELWVHDRSVGRTVVQALRRPGESTAELAPVVAVRSVEFVRANLASLDLALTVDLPDAHAVVAPSAPPPLHVGWGVAMSLGWLDGVGAVGPAALPALSLMWLSKTPWLLELRAMGLGASASYEGGAGKAQLSHHLIMAIAGYRLVQRPHFELAVGAGLGAYRARLAGRSAGPPFEDRVESTPAAAAQAGVGGLLWLHRHAFLRLDAAAVGTLPAVVARVGPEEWGRSASPALLATFSAAAVF